jgi:hypothetical protein
MFCLIDFKNFISYLYDEAPSLFEGKSYEVLHYFINRAVVQSYIGPKFRTETRNSFKAPSCFSIYLPNRPGIYHDSYGDLYLFMDQLSEDSTGFIKRYRWAVFVTKYIQSLKDKQDFCVK